MVKKPTGWGEASPSAIPACANAKGATKILRTTSKVSPVVNETDQAVGGVLLDKNSNLVHYEVYMNKPMFQYVLENEFYNALKQAGSDINFPEGSMELKASWRILDRKNKKEAKRYHTAEALVYIPEAGKLAKDTNIPDDVRKKIDTCSVHLVGLVGLHIVYKTPSNPNFVWMTFEHNDNLETEQTKKEGITPSFFDKSKITDETHLNCRQWDCPDQEMTQVTRQNPIPDWVKNANKKYQKKLKKKKSIWANYELIGVQWATDSKREGEQSLPNLANSTMETFNQTASSCIGCHTFARSTNPTILSDFSWVMGRAQSPKYPDLPQMSENCPEQLGRDLLNYVMYAKPYKKWGTWKDTTWNKFYRPFEGENPHGKTVRIYVDSNTLKAYEANPSMTELPEGAIVLKENFHTPPDKPVHSGDLVELTIMYKAKPTPDSESEWFWVKSPPYGPVEIASFNAKACISCHMNWKGNGDGMLTFNFGKRPVITKTAYPDQKGK
ncbi:MAG: cytochrome P460 family protein [Crocinitomicaceae bacterium]|nr:cytochrome P460 family protein [Crocinitomicaceae bacterium]